MSRGRVLVTRTQPSADATAAKLAALGYEPIVAPFSKTVPLHALEFPERIDAVAISSTAALRHAPETVIERLRDVPCFCVGEASARAATERGLARAEAAGGDLESLAKLAVSRLKPSDHLVYLAGRYRVGNLQKLIGAADVRITTIETYDTVPERPDIDALTRTPAPRSILLHSTLAADVLARMAGLAGFGRWISGSRILCLSSRIAAHVPPSLSGRVEVSPAKDEEAILGLLAGK